MDWRPYDPAADRERAHALLRALLAAGPLPFTIHPGEWDWWTFHRGDSSTELLIAPDAVAVVVGSIRLVAAFGADARATAELGERAFGGEPFVVDMISVHDTARRAQLQQLGFTPTDNLEPVFVRPTSGGVPNATLADGFTIRNLHPDEADLRSAAARRSFKNTMEPSKHAARYRQFMRSVAYDGERDIVAIAPDGRLAAFAIHWPDSALSLAQFEPVGTDPDFQRRGLARAIITWTLQRLESSGIERARVMTAATNTAAATCYTACGFELVDRLETWQRDS